MGGRFSNNTTRINTTIQYNTYNITIQQDPPRIVLPWLVVDRPTWEIRIHCIQNRVKYTVFHCIQRAVIVSADLLASYMQRASTWLLLRLLPSVKSASSSEPSLSVSLSHHLAAPSSCTIRVRVVDRRHASSPRRPCLQRFKGRL